MTSAPQNSLECMVGVDLAGYKIEKRHKVYQVNEDGFETKVLGFFRDKNLAEAYRDNLPDSSYYHVVEVFVLICGGEGFCWLLGQAKFIPVFDEDQVRHDVRSSALSKLTPAEQELLGLNQALPESKK